MTQKFCIYCLGITGLLLVVSNSFSQEPDIQQQDDYKTQKGIVAHTRPEVVGQIYSKSLKDMERLFSEMKEIRPFIKRSLLMEILDNKPLQNTLELKPWQMSEIKKLSLDAKKIYKETPQEFEPLVKKFEADPENSELKKELDEAEKEFKKKVLAETEKIVSKMDKEILVDFQIQMLDMIVWRKSADHCLPRSINPLAWPLVYGEAIGMSNAELEALKKKVEDTSKKLEIRISEAKESARNEILNSLPNASREKFKKIFDRKFSLDKIR